MNNYTIYCTPEQTKKALELGAPIEKDWIPEFLFNNEYFSLKNPTAEQMISWLESNPLISEIRIEQNIFKNWFYTIFDELNYLPIGVKYSSSRKEATLAAIDAALEHLANNNNLIK